MKQFLILITLLVATYGLYVETLTDSNFQANVIKSKTLYMVEFFAPWCGHCKQLAPEYEKAAKALEGIIKLGAVDMDQYKSVGGPYGIQGFPTLKFFGENKNSPIDYQGGREANSIVNFCIEQAKQTAQKRLSGKSQQGGGQQQGGQKKPNVEGEVVVLDQNNFDSSVINSEDAWFVEFYAPWCGHCKKLEPEWKALAGKVKGQVKVGKVDADANKQLGSRFGVSGYPTIKFFPGGKKSDASALPYEGARDAESMTTWGLQQASKTVPLKLKQMITADIFNEFAKDFNGVSLIVFLPHIYDSSAEERKSYIKVIEDVANKNRGKPFSFLWSVGGEQFNFEDNFGVGGSGYPAVLALNMKKQVYSVLRASFSEKNLVSYISDMIAGKGSFTKYFEVPKIKTVKAWDGKDAKPPVTNDEDL